MTISPIDQTIWRLVANGATSDNIAAHLGVSTASVNKRTRKLRRKFGCRNLAQLVLAAVRSGLVSP